jgi:fatty-acyl-CoA synthase
MGGWVRAPLERRGRPGQNLQAMEMPKSRTAGGLLRELAARQGGREAIVSGDRRLTYAELAAEARACARGLHRLGVRRGDRVAVLMGNRPEWLVAYFGAMSLGAGVVGVNTWATARELAYQLGHAKAAVLIAATHWRDRDFAALLAEIERPPALKHLLSVGEPTPPGWRPFAELAAFGEAVSEAELAAAEGEVGAQDLACLLYTSGSTARPKGVPLLQGHLIENSWHIGERQRQTADDRLWLAVSMFWSFACANALLATMTHGGTVVLQHDFEPGEALRLIEAERCTVFYGTPNMALALAQHPDRAKRDLSSLRCGATIGTPEQMRLVVELGVTKISNVYGLTEAYGNSAVCDADDPLEVRLTACGQPLPGVTVKIVDPETRQPVAPGGVGEICLKGRLTPGYLDDPERTAEAFDAEGFLLTGDLGFLDEAGRIRFRGRLKEMVKTGGINVAPAEIEEVLSAHPAVELAFVTGVPDAKLDEALAAAVVLRPGMTATADELTAHCRAALAAYKRPRRWRFIEASALPLTTTGKLQRNRLPELVAAAG